jgi:DNA topoisomerase IA
LFLFFKFYFIVISISLLFDPLFNYDLVVRHFLACCSEDGIGHETVVNIDIAGEKFTAKGAEQFSRYFEFLYMKNKIYIAIAITAYRKNKKLVRPIF